MTTPTATTPAVGMSFPAPVGRVVDGLAEALGPRVRGRVLDLGTADGRAVLSEAIDGAGSTELAETATFDTIVSIGGLVHQADLWAAVRAIEALLDPTGTLLLVEPVDRPVSGGLVLGSLAALHPRTRRLHVNRDIPAALRRSSLSIVDIERITMPTPIWSLRSFVALTAARVVATPGAEASAR